MKIARLVAFASGSIGCAIVALAVACGGDDASSGPRRPVGTGAGDDGGKDATLAHDGSGGPPPDTGPDTNVPPLNAVDAADTPDGGARVDPGVVPCGFAPCNVFGGDQCCLSGDPDASGCLATSVACDPNDSTLECNESADCVVGTVCCASFHVDDAGAIAAVTRCQASCGGGTQLCHTNGECPAIADGGCVIQQCTDGVTYEMCGAFAGDAGDDSGFACTPQ